MASTVKSSASLAWFDPVSCSLKTSQQSLLTDSEPSSPTLPRSGMTRNGYVYELPTVGRTITGTGGGYWPTPNVPNGGRSVAHVTDWRSERTAYHNGKKVQIGLESAVKYWPTPTVCGNHNRKGLSKTSGDGLATAVKMWPTPTAQDAKNNGAPSQMERNTKPLNAEVGGALNPIFCEWLMAFPLGFTVSRDWVMRKFHSKPQSHGDCLPAND